MFCVDRISESAGKLYIGSAGGKAHVHSLRISKGLDQCYGDQGFGDHCAFDFNFNDYPLNLREGESSVTSLAGMYYFNAQLPARRGRREDQVFVVRPYKHEYDVAHTFQDKTRADVEPEADLFQPGFTYQPCTGNLAHSDLPESAQTTNCVWGRQTVSYMVSTMMYLLDSTVLKVHGDIRFHVLFDSDEQGGIQWHESTTKELDCRTKATVCAFNVGGGGKEKMEVPASNRRNLSPLVALALTPMRKPHDCSRCLLGFACLYHSARL